jgi:hypothetical protein
MLYGGTLIVATERNNIVIKRIYSLYPRDIPLFFACFPNRCSNQATYYLEIALEGYMLIYICLAKNFLARQRQERNWST